MTYFGFLAQFLGAPLVLLGVLSWRDRRRGPSLPATLASWPVGWVLLVHVALALTYTTPWDNYLVATRVWWYDPALVTGITLGWVPLEEYTFFVLQPLLTGLWLSFLARRLPSPPGPGPERPRLRYGLAAAAGLIWLGAAGLLLGGRPGGTYLALILVWALPPLALQLAFGADILWRYRSLVLGGLLPPSLYLGLADALAIQAGTWTINPAHSLNWLLGGVLPVEEALFFLLTNTLLVFGMVLALARESLARMPAGLKHRLNPAAGT